MNSQEAPQIQKSMKRRASSAYVVLTASFLLMAIAYGAQSSFGVFFKPMSSEFGWTRTVTSGPYSLYMIVSGVLGIIAGKLSDRFGPRLVVTLGGIFLGSGYLLMSRITHLAQLYIFYGVLVAIGTCVFFVSLASMVARLFVQRRGLMTGIAMAGTGLGVAIIPPIAAQLNVAYGWRVSLLRLGAGAMALILVLAQFLKGKPDNIRPPEDARPDAVAPSAGISFEGALRTRQFWMLCGIWFLYGFYVQAATVHMVPHATDIGMSAVGAATILTTIGSLSGAGRATLGLASDRIGNRRILGASFVLISAVFWGLAAVNATWMLYLFAVVFGFFTGCMVVMSPTVAEFFGLRALGAILGAISLAWSIGSAIGPIVAGRIFDSTGSYHLAFILYAVLSLVSLTIVPLLKRKA